MIDALIAAGIAYVIIIALRSRLKPGFTKLELAKDSDEADRVMRKWKAAGTTGWAVATLLIDVLLFIPCYCWLAFTVTVGIVGATGAKGLENTIWIAFGLTILAAIGNIVQDALQFVTVITGKARAVFISRPLAWVKLGVLVTWVVIIILWSMRWTRVHQQQVAADPLVVLAALITATLIVAAVFANYATTLSRNKPSLLAFLLAPNRIAAKDVLERWGTSGRRTASIALLLDALLALLYGLTVATLCATVADRIDNLTLADLARYAEKGIILAAALHLAQNLGALIAVRRKVAGWWIDTMRRLGWARLMILGLVACFFIVLLIRAEWKGMVYLTMRLKEFIAEAMREA
jgi:hypothetical protein